MARETLVSQDVDAGRRIVAALSAAGFPVSAAFWLYYSDTESWRLWIGTPEAGADRDLHAAYIRLVEILAADGSGVNVDEIDRIKLVRPDDPMIKAMQSIAGGKSLKQFKVAGTLINGIYIEEAFVYKTAA